MPVQRPLQALFEGDGRPVIQETPRRRNIRHPPGNIFIREAVKFFIGLKD
jgi:hypothetical protein